MLFHGSTTEDVDGATNLVRSLMERLKHSSYHRDGIPVSNATLDDLRGFDDLLIEASSTIRQYLNTATPINRFPGEVLSDIFALSATEALPSCSSGQARVPFVVVQKLRSITLVCRSWRNLALHTPLLWRDVVLDRRWRKELSSRCLVLAKTVPLRIHTHRASSDDILRVFKESGHCVREAYFQVDDLGWPDIIDSLPTRPPLLTHLAIVANPFIGPRRPDPQYFGGLAPGLQRLYLNRILFLPTDKFPNLTHLVVDGCKSFALRSILSVLSSTPRLQIAVLTMETPIEEGSVAQCDTDAIVQLPHLRQLVLKDRSPLSIMALLSVIKFPSTCLIQIGKQMDKNLLSIVSLLYTQDFPQNLTRLHIMPDPVLNDGDEDNPNSLYFLEFFNDAGTSGLSLGIREPYSGLWTADDRIRVTDTLVQFLSSAVGAKLVSNVRQLWVHNWTDLVNDRLLAVIPSIDTLGVVLARPPYVQTEIPELIGQLGEDGTLRCPNLTSLYVYTCGGEDVDRARMVATARKDAGHPLQRLAVECEKEKPEVRCQALELEGFVDELSVTVGESRRAWWKSCAVREGWARYRPCRRPEWH